MLCSINGVFYDFPYTLLYINVRFPSVCFSYNRACK
ncbi:hypothetical protein BACOVA_01716 [Bacteroides ovatus ATCC 8483]|uniref:Uncharacterized protein n=1 Tax=Bacteroides ovatus (strain ATCC 8483 / DSM 1896 / JCM 5824 / BCRC 10623 / CCUG 4943 / NCTC 11153) TaxID=411476 RepID=A0AAN3D8K8_BACO1|nr:hypothetical protein BACOVA_01716 [Bacteroides ovatus ATCC 8483]